MLGGSDTGVRQSYKEAQLHLKDESVLTRLKKKKDISIRIFQAKGATGAKALWWYSRGTDWKPVRSKQRERQKNVGCGMAEKMNW